MHATWRGHEHATWRDYDYVEFERSSEQGGAQRDATRRLCGVGNLTYKSDAADEGGVHHVEGGDHISERGQLLLLGLQRFADGRMTCDREREKKVTSLASHLL